MTPIDPVFLLIPMLQAIKPVSIRLLPLFQTRPDQTRPCLWSSLPQPQNDGSAGLFQPLDDIFDEAVQKIVRPVNGRTSSDDALAFPPISPEDVLSLTKYDCIINGLNRICDCQSAPLSLLSLSFSSEEIVLI
jgi:ribonuclease H2 subunit B